MISVSTQISVKLHTITPMDQVNKPNAWGYLEHLCRPRNSPKINFDQDISRGSAVPVAGIQDLCSVLRLVLDIYVLCAHVTPCKSGD